MSRSLQNAVIPDYEVVDEDVLTGETGAELWSEVLGRPIKYVGDDLDQGVAGEPEPIGERTHRLSRP